jgi:hypothetical protein
MVPRGLAGAGGVVAFPALPLLSSAIPRLASKTLSVLREASLARTAKIFQAAVAASFCVSKVADAS